MFENIILNISKHISLSEVEKQDFIDSLHCKSFNKKTILLREGEICTWEGYIHKGCVRSFYVNDQGDEVTLQFGVEDWWVSDIASFYEQKPSIIFIETLEDTELYTMSYEAKEKLLLQHPKFERVFRILMQRHLVAIQQRLINTISKSATERYLEFIEMYPSIPLRVQQYYIASYLGVSAEFISKIRKRLSTS